MKEIKETLDLRVEPFPEIIGHERILESLKRYFQQRWRGGTLMLAGPAGTGKRLIATRFAMGYVCENQTFLGCQECPPCRRVIAGQHPDVRVAMNPPGKNHPIETVREFQNWVVFRPWTGDCKIFIWDNAEKMRTDGANALLKTLEEPPEDTLIILVTDQLYQVLPTIRSRSQIFRLSSVPETTLIEVLMKKLGKPRNEALWITRMSRGCPGRALRAEPYWTFHRELRDRVFQSFMNWLAEPGRGWMFFFDLDVRPLVPMARELSDERIQVYTADGWMWSRWWTEQVLKHLIVLAMDFLYLSWEMPERIVSIDLRERMRPLVPAIRPEKLMKRVEEWLEFLGRMRIYNFNGLYHIPSLLEPVTRQAGYVI